MRALSLLLLLSLVVLGLPRPAPAHPHGWIDIKTEPLVNGAGDLVGLRQAWLFDELYSAFILDEFAQAGVTREAGLARLLRDDMTALAPHDYFTRIELAGETRDLGAATAYANGVAAGRIWLRFELPLAEPIPLGGEPVRWAVFDPTYFIEILHHGEEPVRLTPALAKRCTASLIAPQPPPEIVGFAAMLDRNATDDEGLGVHFAEWVELRCGLAG